MAYRDPEVQLQRDRERIARLIPPLIEVPLSVGYFRLKRKLSLDFPGRLQNWASGHSFRLVITPLLMAMLVFEGFALRQGSRLSNQAPLTKLREPG